MGDCLCTSYTQAKQIKSQRRAGMSTSGFADDFADDVADLVDAAEVRFILLRGKRERGKAVHPVHDFAQII